VIENDPRTKIRSAAAHIAQAKLLLRRVAGETLEPLEVRTLSDLTGVLQYVITAIEELEAKRELGATR
jgi:hypothetical protein